MEPAVLTGKHFINGDEACAEGAMAAGCMFFGGYPITPSSEIAEMMAKRLPLTDGTFVQMEDEIASIMACLGASFAGVKAMTATSGPGLSLMAEKYGVTLCVKAHVGASIYNTPTTLRALPRAGCPGGGRS